jgi:hypothetical protein
MQGKLTLAVGFVAGYVLGSKAGRQRYEEIVAQARKVAGNQTVQSTAGVLQAQASDLVSKAKQSPVVDKVKQTVGRQGDQGSTSGSTTYSTAPAAGAYGTESAYSTESESFSAPSTSTDLFEPTTSSSTTEPLGTTSDPLGTTGDPLTDPLSPKPSGTNGSTP